MLTADTPPRTLVKHVIMVAAAVYRLHTTICSQVFVWDFMVWNLQVGKAVEHVAAGTAQLQKAKTLRRGTRKCMCIAIILLLLTALILILAVVQPWKKATK